MGGSYFICNSKRDFLQVEVTFYATKGGILCKKMWVTLQHMGTKLLIISWFHCYNIINILTLLYLK